MRSSSRAIDPAQKPILSHRQKLSQANKNPRLTAGGCYLGGSPMPPESQRAGGPLPRPLPRNPPEPLFSQYAVPLWAARQFLPGAALPRSARRVLPSHAKRPRTMAGSFSVPEGAGSAALLQAVDGKGIEPKALIKPESCFIAVGHTEFPGAALSRTARRVLPTTQKDPARWRGLFYSGRSRISCASAGSRW